MEIGFIFFFVMVAEMQRRSNKCGHNGGMSCKVLDLSVDGQESLLVWQDIPRCYGCQKLGRSESGFRPIVSHQDEL